MLSPGLEHFRAVMEADPALQEKLDRPDDPASFIALVMACAREYGITLAAEQIAAALLRARAAPATTSSDASPRLPPVGWLPIRARWRDRELEVDWAYIGPRPLRKPFFEQNVAHCLHKPFNRLFHYATPIGALADVQRQRPYLTPDGFIFHMSRCGSTLVSQMLAASPRHIVISEAEPIDTVVQARHARPDLTEEEQVAMLRWVIAALGQVRSGDERHLFVKLDSWHALALPLFRRAFPDTPWIFVYRDPVEILVSQLRKRGMHMVPGLIGDLFGLPSSGATPAPETYCAQVLSGIGESILRHQAAGRGLLVNYRQLPAAVWSEVLPHFGSPCCDDDRAAMADVARYDAKRPDLAFTDDSLAKRRAATPAILSAANRLSGLHARLEALRLATDRSFARSRHG